jgi:hypothetical protein
MDIIPLITNYHVVYIEPMCVNNNSLQINKNKKNDNVTIKINNVKMEKICKNIFDLSSSKVNKNLLFIVLKIPINYDVFYLYNELSNCGYKIKMHNIAKSLVIVIIPK